MTSHLRKLGLIFLILVSGLALGQEPETLFQQGVEKYRQGDWPEAVSAWEQIHDHGEVSGALFYNLGNAYHRMGQIGRSILYYERAKKLMPRDRDVHANLDLAKMATVDRIEPPIRLIVWDWVDSLRDYFSLNELAGMLIALGIAVVIVFGLWRIGPLRVREPSRSLFVVMLVCYLLVAGWYVWRSKLDARTYAVVIETKVDVFSAPDSTATQVFTLHEGSKVLTSDNLTGWTRIRLADGRQGWLPLDTIERI